MCCGIGFLSCYTYTLASYIYYCVCVFAHSKCCEVAVSWLPFWVHYDGGVSMRLAELNVVAPEVRQCDGPGGQVGWIGLEGEIWGGGGGGEMVWFV